MYTISKNWSIFYLFWFNLNFGFCLLICFLWKNLCLFWNWCHMVMTGSEQKTCPYIIWIAFSCFLANFQVPIYVIWINFYSFFYMSLIYFLCGKFEAILIWFYFFECFVVNVIVRIATPLMLVTLLLLFLLWISWGFWWMVFPWFLIKDSSNLWLEKEIQSK
jgi:hypothetical protein